MATVIMTHGISGPRPDKTGNWPAVGEPLECSDAEAAKLIAAGLAKATDANTATQSETGPEAQPETATGNAAKTTPRKPRRTSNTD